MRLITLEEFANLPAIAFPPIYVAQTDKDEECLWGAGIPRASILTLEDMRAIVANADRRARRQGRRNACPALEG